MSLPPILRWGHFEPVVLLPAVVVRSHLRLLRQPSSVLTLLVPSRLRLLQEPASVLALAESYASRRRCVEGRLASARAVAASWGW